MTETSEIIVRTVESSPYDAIDLINKVDAFYNNAWGKLILFGSISFAIVGIIVPLLIPLYQQRTLKLSEDLLKNEINNIKGEIFDELSKKYEP